MGNVEFDEEKSANDFTSRRLFNEAAVPGMSRFLIKWKVVKSPREAKWVMIFVIIVSLGVSAYLLITTFFPNAFTVSKNTAPAQSQLLKNRQAANAASNS